MREVEKYLFDRMVDQINGLAKFVTAVGKNELRKISAIRAELQKQREATKGFMDTLQRRSTSPASAASAKAMAGLKKPMRELLRNIDAIESGIDNGELNLTKFRNLVRSHIKPSKDKLVEIAQTFYPSGMTEEDLEREARHLSQTKGSRDAAKILKGAGKRAEEAEDSANHGPDPEAQKAMKGYLKHKTKLPTSLKGRLFQLVQMPVVPFVDFRLMTPSFLRKTGIEFSYIDDSFPVLEKQYLLAFDLVKATEYKGRKTGEDAVRVQGLKARKRRAKHQTMQEQFVLEVVDQINGMSDEDYVLVSSHFEGNPQNGKIAFAWIMPRNTYKMFERTGNLSNFQWGFPWSREAAAVL
tara:strand:+ start:8096 stop:9157 length:1062 start_codon:yes stop_codon:yes gene_type:complete